MHRPITRTISASAVLSCCGLLIAGCAVSDDVSTDDVDDVDTIEQDICADPPCDGDPEGGGQRPKPKTPRVTARTGSSLTVSYTIDSGWTSYQLQRRPFGGTWTLGAGTNNPAAGSRSYTDSGKTADTRHCYRLRAVNAAGTTTTPEACGLTSSPASATNPRINRLQLRVEVSDIADAGTTADVSARLSSLSLPVMHFNALNPAPRRIGNDWIDSFATNNTFTYELELHGMQRLRDISEISLHNWGTDALCVERIDLLVNGGVALTKIFGASSCRVIETEAGSVHPPELLISFDEIRLVPSFTNFTNPGPVFEIRREETEARIEAMIGNIIFNQDVKWGTFGNRAVQATFLSPSSMRVAVDLEGEVEDLPNPHVDFDFDLVLGRARSPSNTGWDLTADVVNVTSSVDFSWWTDLLAAAFGPLGLTAMEVLEHHIEDGIEESFALETQRIPMGDGACSFPNVPTVRVDSIASIWSECGPP
jgi:hypothetical protein